LSAIGIYRVRVSVINALFLLGPRVTDKSIWKVYTNELWYVLVIAVKFSATRFGGTRFGINR
jgi:hypothetical protein